MSRYSKLIVAVVGLLVVILGPEFLGAVEDTETTAQLVLALLTAFGVYQVPNKT